MASATLACASKGDQALGTALAVYIDTPEQTSVTPRCYSERQQFNSCDNQPAARPALTQRRAADLHKLKDISMPSIPTPPYADDPQCRETYVETVQVLIDTAGLLRIELCVYRWPLELPAQPNRLTPVARLAMPVGLGAVLRDQLAKTIEVIDQSLRMTREPAPSGQTKN